MYISVITKCKEIYNIDDKELKEYAKERNKKVNELTAEELGDFVYDLDLDSDSDETIDTLSISLYSKQHIPITGGEI